MPRVAIDSNVLVSALHFGGTPEALLLLAEVIKIVTPRECLDALEHPPRG